jgi:hypothetical protein
MAGTNPITSWIKACMETYQGREEWMEGASPERGRGGPGGRGIVFRRSGRRLSFFCYYVINPPSRRCLSHKPPSLPLAPPLLTPSPPPLMTLLYPDSSLPAPDDTAPPPPSRALFFCDIGPFTPFVDKLARGSHLPQRPHCRVSKRLDY